jgi:beta-glucosidase
MLRSRERILIAFILSLFSAAGLIFHAQKSETPAYLDPTLPIERRVADLVGRMTLDEKISQMMDRAPAIPRLQIPEYNWWNEALHGVGRAGLATVFPQAIGFAATWNDDLIFRMATVISDEARAKHHDAVRRGIRDRYYGLTIWSPNINLFRDPRWGRGQETYGEDPFLTARLAINFVRGLQGDDPKYLKTVSTVKHYAVHSGPEPERHTFDAVVDERTLHEDYLRHFEWSIRDGGAYSVMCAYNRLNGDPACSSRFLLEDILRGRWGFTGYVVSDCGAIDDIYMRHKVVPTAAEAAVISVKAGTDLECGTSYKALQGAVKGGAITEAEIDVAMKRLCTARMKLGMFDPPSMVTYARIPVSTLDSQPHRAVARTVARESIVLLQNEGGVLPLRKDLGTLAVIGPNADEWRMLLGNYNGLPADPVTPLRGIREAVGKTTRVLSAVGSELAEGFPVYDVLRAPVLFTPEGKPGLRVEYFAGRAMTGAPDATSVERTVDVNWREAAPRPGLPADDFAVRWTGTLRPAQPGQYRLGLVGTVKYRLYIDDTLALESRYPQRDGEYPDARPTYSKPLALEAGREYRLRVEGEESYGIADLQLLWATPSELLETEALDAARKADAVVLVLGLTPRLEGEEMPVAVPGFRGGDRTAIELPAPQQRLLERVVAVGKPTVLVLMSGSAVAVEWAQQHVPAIVEAWYPGQAGGTAIADVLFGDYNPAGRLPITFYRSTSDLPDFEEYAMKGRTYRYFEGKPLYPFGHGLSYTTFRYDRARASAPTLRAGGTITVSVDLTNTGKLSGDEVVQLYAQHVDPKLPRPLLELRGFRRVSLKPGETRTVSLPLRADDLAYWDMAADRWVVEPGRVRLRVGASSADLRVETTVEVRGR